MTDHVNSEHHYRALEALAGDTFGVDVAYRWSAFDYVTTDLLPYIGRLSPNSRRRFVATGFRKWGMTTSMLAANDHQRPDLRDAQSVRVDVRLDTDAASGQPRPVRPTPPTSPPTGSVTGSEVPASRWHRSGNWRSAKAGSRTGTVSPSPLRAVATARCTPSKQPVPISAASSVSTMQNRHGTARATARDSRSTDTCWTARLSSPSNRVDADQSDASVRRSGRCRMRTSRTGSPSC